jgi:hypothetical protein
MLDELKYEQRIVAFIDILGFKEIVRRSENDTATIGLLYTIINYFKSWEKPLKWDLNLIEIEEDAQKKGVSTFDIKGKTNITSFSDCIVVSVIVNGDVNKMTSTLVANLAFIGANLMEQGILFRGGLTIGNIFHNNNGIVFGQALIDAFELEQKHAKYPRIILSDKLIKELNYPIEAKKERYPYHQYFDRFDDDCVGFHQMKYYEVIQSCIGITNKIMISSIAKIRKTIIDGLDNSFEHSDVFEKYQWMKLQYNNLSILSDLDSENQSDENIKMKIRELNEDLFGKNIHYSYTDNFYEKRRKNQIL